MRAVAHAGEGHPGCETESGKTWLERTIYKLTSMSGQTCLVGRGPRVLLHHGLVVDSAVLELLVDPELILGGARVPEGD